MTCDVLLDVGGTGIKGSALARGEIRLPYAEFPSRAGEPCEALAGHLTAIIRELAGGMPVRRIAMAFPGPFDYDRGIPMMRGLDKYESLYGVCLPQLLAPRLGEAGITPQIWYFINDASAFALGACAALGLKGRVMNVCLGTGAGSGFIVDGRLTQEPDDGVPAGGWIYPIPYDGATVDDHFSDRGVRALSQRMCGRRFSPLELNLQADAGSQIAREIWQVFGARMANIFRILLLDFRADALVLSGKIARAEKWFAAPLRAMCGELGVRLVIEPDTTRYILQGLGSDAKA